MNNFPQGTYTLKQLIDMQIERVPFLWQDYIPQQGFGILTGPSDSSKSTFMRQLGFFIACGNTEFLGKALNIRKGKVLIIATEDGKTATAAIVRRLNAHQFSEDVQNKVCFSFKPMRQISVLDAMLTIFPVDIVMFDTWTDTFRDDINNPIKVRENLEAINEMAVKHNCFMLGIHHNRKGGDPNNPNKQNVLGSQAIEAYARVVLDLRHSQDNKRKLTIVKGNYVPDALKNRPVSLDVNPENFQLSLSNDQSGYGLDASRIQVSNRDKYFNIVKNLAIEKEEYTQDAIVQYLKDTFTNEKTPSKGTVNAWIQEIKSSQSKSKEEMID
jgi:RecA-family ATPase